MFHLSLKVHDNLFIATTEVHMLSRWYILYYHRNTLTLPKGSCLGVESRWKSRGEKQSD